MFASFHNAELEYDQGPDDRKMTLISEANHPMKPMTVLVVYYEEGAGSSIRARRLRATQAGIEWLPMNKSAN